MKNIRERLKTWFLNHGPTERYDDWEGWVDSMSNTELLLYIEIVVGDES